MLACPWILVRGIGPPASWAHIARRDITVRSTWLSLRLDGGEEVCLQLPVQPRWLQVIMDDTENLMFRVEAREPVVPACKRVCMNQFGRSFVSLL